MAKWSNFHSSKVRLGQELGQFLGATGLMQIKSRALAMNDISNTFEDKYRRQTPQAQEVKKMKWKPVTNRPVEAQILEEKRVNVEQKVSILVQCRAHTHFMKYLWHFSITIVFDKISLNCYSQTLRESSSYKGREI